MYCSARFIAVRIRLGQPQCPRTCDAPSPPAPIVPDHATSVDPTPASLRLLIADRDADAGAALESGLRARLGAGVDVVHCLTMAQTVRSLMDISPDAVLLDLALPDAGGIATLVGVRCAAPLVPIIVHTTPLDDGLALRALRAGAQECVDRETTTLDSLVRVLGFGIERQRRLAALEAARVEASHRATHDPLTGLANRELFMDQLERALASGSRYHRKTGLLFVDLDDFKAINDTCGHALGDLLLKTVASRLLECVRRSDAVARLGGDEFIVLLPDVTSRRDVAFVKSSIIDAFRAPVLLGDGGQLTVEASIGCAMSPLDGVDAQALIDAADASMYREKYKRHRGRVPTPVSGVPALGQSGDRYRGHTPEHDSGATPLGSVMHRRETRLRAAIGRSEFEVHYQPIVDVVTDAVIAVEALLRWREPDRGLLSPQGFLQLAEDTGLIVPIGEQVLQQACRAIGQWRRSHPSLATLRVAVNLSAVQLREHGFERRVAHILAETGCPPDALTLELTENSTLVDGETAMETLRALKRLGLRLVVDDFGVGHASLTFLREAPLDGLKIDRRFVAQVMLDSRDHAIASGMVRLARGLGLEVTAEGVESAEQSQRLARLRCFAQQGQHFGSAQPFAATSAMLNTRTGSAIPHPRSPETSPRDRRFSRPWGADHHPAAG